MIKPRFKKLSGIALSVKIMEKTLKIDMGNSDVYRPVLWGDTAGLSELVGRDASIHEDHGLPVGEVFVLSSWDTIPSRFEDGRKVLDVLEGPESGKRVFGDKAVKNGYLGFSLSYLSAKERLSLHNHNKPEIFVAMSPGNMICGLNRLGERKLSKYLHALENGQPDELEKYMFELSLQADDVLFVSKGVPHSTTNGSIFIAYGEYMKESSEFNPSMRGYDWGRNDPRRLLDKEKFLRQLERNQFIPSVVERLTKHEGNGSKVDVLSATNAVALEEVELDDGKYLIDNMKGNFYVVSVTDGEIYLNQEMGLRRGESAILTAGNPRHVMEGNGLAFLSYSPDVDADIIYPLRNKNYPLSCILKLGDLWSPGLQRPP